MSNEVCGIPAENFEDSTQAALKRFAEWSLGKLEFDLEKATVFKYDPETQFVRSRSLVRHMGRFATQLDIFIVPPERDLCDTYLKQEKENLDTEVYLALASKKLRPEMPITMFAGHLAVLKAVEDGFKEIGHLGQSRIYFDYITEHKNSIVPEATVIRGYRGALDELGCKGERFGDNCKIANTIPNTIQVCGLVGLNSEEMEKGTDLLRALRPTEY